MVLGRRGGWGKWQEGDNGNLNMGTDTRRFLQLYVPGFVINVPSKSQMYSLRVTEMVCPEDRHHLLLDKPKSTGVEHHSS